MNLRTPLPLRIAPELDALAVDYDGTRLHFVTSQAFPPGKPISMTLHSGDDGSLSLEARCLGSKRRQDGQFDVQARLINLARNTRSALERAFAKDS
jgi:hypothetical protein